MGDRRKFLKQILAGGVAGAVLGLGQGAEPGAQAASSSGRPAEPFVGYTRQGTVFCQFAHPALASSIGWLAKELGCEICWGEPFSPDIIAVPSFALIVDRNTLTQEQWADYLGFRAEVEDATACVLVDRLGAAGDWAIDAHMQIRDPGDKAQVRSVLERIQQAHRLDR